jgi:hypothetical protein
MFSLRTNFSSEVENAGSDTDPMAPAAIVFRACFLESFITVKLSVFVVNSSLHHLFNFPYSMIRQAE